MFGKTPLVMVEDQASLEAMVEILRGAPVIGVDTESDSFHSFQEKVCLIQISDLHSDYIVDPLSIEDMSPLGECLSNTEQVKILHGADYDIVCMKRDYGFEFKNIFDTMISAQFLGFDKLGLADLIKKFFGHHIDKQYQRHDWSKRPLLQEHLDYARGDTHWLPAIREVLTIQLKRAQRLEAVLEEFEIVQGREWGGRTDHESDFLRVKRSGTLEPDGKRVLRAVWEYRNGKAREANRPPFKLLPDHFLIDLAQRQPQNPAELQAMARKGSSMLRRHGDSLLKAVHAGLADTRPIPKPQERKRERTPRNGPGIDRYLGPLKEWRNNRVAKYSISPVAVANNTLLKEIARKAPTNLEELSAVTGIRKWQLIDFADELLDVIESVPAGTSDPEKPKRRRRGRTKPTDQD
jgi:ribonuclease D